MPVKLTHEISGAELLFQRLTVHEELGRPYQGSLEVLSESMGIKIADALGTNIEVCFDLPDNGQRWFHGLVTQFTFTGFHGRHASYHIVVRPKLWLLSRAADCRIFQNKKIPDIVKSVLQDAPHNIDVKDNLQNAGKCPTLEFCVQYRETDLDFVHRLMEEAGIYYFFEHAAGSHKMVLADDPNSHKPVGGYDEVPFYPPGGEVRRERDHIDEWEFAGEVQSGRYALRDFDFVKPSANMEVKAKLLRNHPFDSMEIYDYPGDYVQPSDGTSYADIRLQELQARYEMLRGGGDAAGLAAGAVFTLTGHPRADQDRKYLLTSVTHSLSSESHHSEPGVGGREAPYSCRFTAIEAKTRFRPARVTPKPVVQGPQTAIVVGKSKDSKDEIHTDEHGRVRVQFHWDRKGESNPESSCMIRVGQIWAGSNWGAIHIPRIGQEVIVSFLEGDPDRPIITGRVYNGENKPPYALPANQTQSGIKSRSSKGGAADNFNEIRMEDKKGEEELYIHAEKDETEVVENDQTVTIGNNQGIKVEKDRTEEIGGDRSLTVGGSKTEEITGSKTVKVGKDHDESVDGAMKISVSKSRTMSVTENLSEDIDGSMTLAVAKDRRITVDQSLKEEIGKNVDQKIGGARTVTVQKDSTLAAKRIQIKADEEISLVVGSASITMKSSGEIVIKGKKIEVKGSGDVVIKGSKIAQN